MSKIPLASIEPPRRERKTFGPIAIPGVDEPMTLTVRKLGSLDAISMVSFGQALYQQLAADHITFKGEIIHASEATCELATMLAIAQAPDDPDDVYTEQELIVLMQFDHVVLFFFDIRDWVTSEASKKDDGPKNLTRSRKKLGARSSARAQATGSATRG